MKDGRFERAEAVLLWLLDTTISYALRYEKEQNCWEACKVYILLLKISTNVGRDSYTRTEEAIELFCETYHSSHRTDDEEATQKTLNLVEEVWGQTKMSSWRQALRRG